MKFENQLIGSSLLTAITASLCCITPVLAIIAGTSGMASVFSWIEPFRPYLIGISVIVLGFAWYQKLYPKAFWTKKDKDCECSAEKNPKFIQSKIFLGIVTVLSIIMLAFPYYSRIFYPKIEKNIIVVDKLDTKTMEFKINGMTCASCEEHVNHEVNKLNGILKSKISYINGNALIKFDKTKTNKTEIENAINATGFKVSSKKEN
ncbi:mercuric transport protein MerTP [Yeosuana sp. AK3]